MSPSLAGRRVLIADDHRLFAEGLRALLRDHDCEAEIVTELALIETTIAATEPDLLILDLSFGTESALPLLHQLRDTQPALPILVVSASEERVVVERVQETGAAYLAKSRAGADVALLAGAMLDGSYRAPAATRPRAPTRASRQIGGVKLSRALIQVLKLARLGLSNPDIAEQIGRTVKTVEAHMGEIYNRLGLKSRGQVIRWANEHARELGAPLDGS
ncbi:MAG: response regulator transcription factor [Gemmatimonadota bacterium]